MHPSSIETSVSSPQYKVHPMEVCSRLPLVMSTGKIIRRSIYKFLQNYQYFTTTAALFALPFSVSILVSQALVPLSSFLPKIHSRLQSIFYAAGFPPSSELFTVLILKLSQTVVSAVLVLPFTLSFLLIAKAFVFQSLGHSKSSLHSTSSFLSLFKSLLLTQVCNSLIIFSVNATCFSLFFFAFNCLDGLGLSSPKSMLFLSVFGAVFYSIILANASVICQLALVQSGMEKCCSGYMAILKACILIRGRTVTALSLAISINMAMAAVEALFQFRVLRGYHQMKSPTPSMALEGMFIAYLYSILLVLDTVVGCLFFKSCKAACRLNLEECRLLNDIEENSSLLAHFKTSEEVPQNVTGKI